MFIYYLFLIKFSFFFYVDYVEVEVVRWDGGGEGGIVFYFYVDEQNKIFRLSIYFMLYEYVV